MWDERYSAPEYAYGKQPNTFLAEHFGVLPKGRVLSLAEGEGRNAVFLARQGYAVTGVDASQVGLDKARRLADENGVSIELVHADLAAFEIGENCWDGVVSIFCHLPPALRRTVYRHIVAGLKPGGVLLLEGYTPAQLQHGTGGPAAVEMLLTAAILTHELAGLTFTHLAELERDVSEGRYHTGTGAVVQAIAVKH